mgnify:FL=1
MEPKFDHKAVEKKLYKMWEESGAFSPAPETPPYTILMPPPNANASLHAGHGMYTVDDILIRWKRMQGYGAQWIPGRDHAGFETQFVYEKHLKKQGKSRMDFDRQTFYDNVAKFVEDNSGLIFEQFRRLGFSADWKRSVFTLDPNVLETVFTTFQKMEKDELVYRSDYMVNYCTHCGTSLAELEINHTERVGKLYTVEYKLVESDESIEVATTRPETIMLDTHIAVNPDDKKRAKYVGKKVVNPLTEREMVIIADEVADPEFGTGFVKLTPAHDKNDYEAGKRHNLPMIVGIGLNGRMTPEAGEWEGKTVFTARKEVVERLMALRVIETDDKYEQTAATCYKCGRDIEPMMVPNWYIKVDPLKSAVINAVKNGETKIYPQRFEKQLLDWMEIMHDWPISRQVAWGIRIPAWYDTGVNKDLYVNFVSKSGKGVTGMIGELLSEYQLKEIEKGLQALTAPKTAKYVVAKEKPGENYLQETDTFDTWFSSGQWPLVTQTEEEHVARYPTDVMATMSDILRFWVSRMMMFGLYINEKTPFKNVYLWSTVTDSKGQKMSKSKGNVINPIELVDKYGADAFRMSLLFGNGEGGRVPLSDDKVRAMRNFSNKLWNMARFYLMMADGKEIPYFDPSLPPATLGTKDKEILARLDEVIAKMTKLLDKFRFSEAADMIYHFLWHEVASSYIEHVKGRKDQKVALSILRYVFLKGIMLLHPFMPFVTEAIWQEMPRKCTCNLITSKWPGTQ